MKKKWLLIGGVIIIISLIGIIFALETNLAVNGCEYITIVNNHIHDCANIKAIYVRGSYNKVQSNMIEGNSRGVSIEANAASILVTNNYCRNNGSDTGIANDNEHNFDDDATDKSTMCSGNSWQAVVNNYIYSSQIAY